MQRWLFLIGLVWLSNQIAQAAPPVYQINSLGFSGAHGERLNFDLSAATPHHYFMLQHPSRLVVDFDEMTSAPALQAPADHPLIANIRSGIRDKKSLRVVFELKSDANVQEISKLGAAKIQLELTAKQAPLAVQAKMEKAQAPVAPAKKPPQVDSVAVLPKTNPLVKTVASKARGRDIVIAIDAGHGGKDVGAQGANGTQEKDVVFAIAKRLQAMVNHQPGLKALMIRDGDYFVKLRERVRLARAAKADLFVSIHADAFSDASAHGASVYTLANKGASSASARYLADSENAADLLAGSDDKDDTLSSVLMDLSQSAAKQASQNIGTKVLSSVRGVGHLHRTSVQKAGFVVLKSADIPSILVETAFISNPDEERRLNTRAYQDKMASAVFAGIMSHFRQYAPANTLLAQLSKSGKAVNLAKNEAPQEPQATLAPATTVSRKSANLASADIDDGSTLLKTANNNKSQHIIGRGETLSGIAHQYGISMRELRLSNGMSDGNVKVGQILQIPRNS